jgi:phenylpropionate dioxygenase-like ring-hydroxylating dioxygenase large terminal subunit
MSIPEEQFKPPLTKGHSSVARVVDDWYVVCRSERLRAQPLGVTLFGLPIVVFRNAQGVVGALLDRCPHRNAPLSIGRVQGELLQCSYHGWEFNGLGTCRSVPGLPGGQLAKGRNVQHFPVREQDGFVWVYATPDVEPVREPFRFPLIGVKRYTTVCKELEVEGSIHATAENALDVPHTAYLHGGLFRLASGTRHEIKVVVKRFHDRVEAEYVGEPRPAGVAGMLLAPGGGSITHIDRFTLPSIVHVEYRLGDRTHLCVTSALTPVDDFHTKLFAIASLRLPIPGWLVVPFLKPLLTKIFRQDVHILKHQSDNIRRFGGEQFASTEIDVLGPHILRLLKQAERGDRSPSKETFMRTVQMFG